MRPPGFDRATVALGIAAVVSCVFAFTAGLGESVDLIDVRGASVGVAAVLGALAIFAGARRLPTVGLLAGAGFIACALLQLVALGANAKFLGGDGTTVSLFGGIGVGLVSIWLAGRTSRQLSKGSE